ncbi:GGDEF domain-containing protein [Smaragdicoccus niigatensis]|uniref:GGDEF domain-containing protein n=1 Tax=Smaragdicoccus niigatensis TaxID=359359 RepID=UPI00036209D4|nr:GGDEF domain-containing protein [Smaragdicoccus niigatensis]
MDVLEIGDAPIPNRFDSASHEILAFLRTTAPMGVWTVTRLVDGSQVYLSVEDVSLGVSAGDSVPWTETMCRQMVAGQPHIAIDVQNVPAYRAIAEAESRPIAAYVGYPLVTASGQLFGTMCGFGPATLPADFERHGPLIELLSRLLATILDSDLERTRLERDIEHANLRAQKDSLTGLLNRNAWDQMLAQEQPRARRFGEAHTVICIDLDGLKHINDTLGHPAGDDFIRRAGQVLHANARECDLVARVGGDEFGVIAFDSDSASGAALAERLANALEQAGIPASVGHAQCTLMAGLEHAWSTADTAMYERKRNRRGASPAR